MTETKIKEEKIEEVIEKLEEVIEKLEEEKVKLIEIAARWEGKARAYREAYIVQVDSNKINWDEEEIGNLETVKL